MRTIKFRAWNKHSKKMSNFGYGGFQSIGREFIVYEDNGGFVLMQFTGLKDKNGVEIYEGDVVKVGNSYLKDRTDVAEIRWYRGGFMLHLKGHFGFRDIERYDGDSKLHEVIGNIYENPDLLESDTIS